MRKKFVSVTILFAFTFILAFLSSCSYQMRTPNNPTKVQTIQVITRTTIITENTSTFIGKITQTPERKSSAAIEQRTPESTKTLTAWKEVGRGVNTNNIRTMVIDHTGSLWAGGPGGLIYLDVKSEALRLYINGNTENQYPISDLAVSKSGDLWIGTLGGGLARYYENQWQTVTQFDGLPGNFIWNLAPSSKNGVWISASVDKYKHDSTFGVYDDKHWTKFENYRYQKIILSHSGILWGVRSVYLPGTAYYSEIKILDNSGNNQSNWKTVYNSTDEITAITESPNGNIWIATSKGILWYDNVSWHQVIPPWVNNKVHTVVTSMAVTDNGDAWFGLSFVPPDDEISQCGIRLKNVKELGVYKYNRQGWKNYTSADGLVDNKICAIVSDGKNIWFGSYDKGISSFNGTSWKTFNFN